jgi:hypothetical protein
MILNEFLLQNSFYLKSRLDSKATQEKPKHVKINFIPLESIMEATNIEPNIGVKYR